MGNTCDAWVQYQEPAQVHGCFEMVAVVYQFSSMLHLIRVLGFPVLISNVSDCEQLSNGVSEVFEVDGTMRVE